LDSITIRIKRLNGHDHIALPAYATEGSAGMDLRADVKDAVVLNPGEIRLIPTGLAIAIPPGYEAQIRPRSGLALKHGIGMVNSPGTIDSDYRGEIGLIMINWGADSFTIKRGDRIAQMTIAKIYRATVVEVAALDDSKRGEKGFGHSGIE